jgi:hypothetical protein
VPVGAGSLGTPLPVEPGAHVVEVSAPGRADKRFEITLAEGQRSELVVEPGPPTGATDSGEPRASAEGNVGLRTAGFVVGGLGIVGLGIGTAFGVSALSKNAESKDTCDANNVCDPSGKTLRDSARSAGNASTIAFIAGGVLFAAGAVLVLTSPTKKSRSALRVEASPLFARDGAGISLRSTWH